jgi:hypothetical protein
MFSSNHHPEHRTMKTLLSLHPVVSRSASALLLAAAVALLGGCASVGIGIPIGPFSIGVGVGSGGVNLGVGTQVGPVGVGVGVNQDGRVSAGAGVGASVPIGDSKARVGVGVGGSTTIYEPKDKK